MGRPQTKADYEDVKLNVDRLISEHGLLVEMERGGTTIAFFADEHKAQKLADIVNTLMSEEEQGMVIRASYDKSLGGVMHGWSDKNPHLFAVQMLLHIDDARGMLPISVAQGKVLGKNEVQKIAHKIRFLGTNISGPRI